MTNNIITPTFGEEHITLTSRPFVATPSLKTVTGRATILTIDGNDLAVFADMNGVELDTGMVVKLPDGSDRRIVNLRFIKGHTYATFLADGKFSKGFIVPCGELLAGEHDPEDPPFGTIPTYAPPNEPPTDDDDTEEVDVIDPDEADTNTDCYIVIKKGNRHRHLIRIFKNGTWTVYRASFQPSDAPLVVEAIVLAAQIVKELRDA